MPAPTFTTELEAVNEMLARIGELPTSSLENTGLADVVTALSTLRWEARRVQAIGWYWNTDKGLVLARNNDNEIHVPSNCVHVDTVDEDAGVEIVQRGTRLYDVKKHRYTFDKNLKVDMKTLLPFEELPEIARSYITVKASRVFSADFSGGEALPQFSANDEAALLAAMKRDESRQADRNVLANPSLRYITRRS